MPITPDEASKENLISIKGELDKAIVRIDKSLAHQYFGDNKVIVSFNDMNKRIIKEIVIAYQAVGWSVKHGSSSGRNEMCNTFTFTKKQPYIKDQRGL